MADETVYLSIVIPVFNEEPRIQKTLDEILVFLETFPHSWEIIVSDDGSADSSKALVAPYLHRSANVRLLSLLHKGKGWAVKRGMLAAKGEYRLLCDADLSVPIEQVERLLPPQLEGVDVALGSREAEGSRRVGEPGSRHALGRVYNALVRVLALPGFKDTQCGFKCFKSGVVERLFGAQTLDGFGFDVEVLFVARKSGMTVREVGVDWFYREHSKVRPFRDAIAMGMDLLRVRWRRRKVKTSEGLLQK